MDTKRGRELTAHPHWAPGHAVREGREECCLSPNASQSTPDLGFESRQQTQTTARLDLEVSTVGEGRLSLWGSNQLR
jgi:hypothetical protein